MYGNVPPDGAAVAVPDVQKLDVDVNARLKQFTVIKTESVNVPQAVVMVTVYSVVTVGVAYVVAEVGLVTVTGGAHEKVAAVLQVAVSKVLSPAIILVGLPDIVKDTADEETETFPEAEHPFESCTTTEYVPPVNPVMVAVVPPPGDQR